MKPDLPTLVCCRAWFAADLGLLAARQARGALISFVVLLIFTAEF